VKKEHIYINVYAVDADGQDAVIVAMVTVRNAAMNYQTQIGDM